MWQRGQVLTWNFKAASVSGGFPGFPGPKHPVSTPERAVAAAPREGKAKAKAATPAPQTPQPQAAPAAAPAPVEEPIVTPKEEVVGETLKTMHLGFEDMKSCFENEKINDSKYTFSFFWQVFSSFTQFRFDKVLQVIEAKSLGDHGPHGPIARRVPSERSEVASPEKSRRSRGSKACTERGAGFDGFDALFGASELTGNRVSFELLGEGDESRIAGSLRLELCGIDCYGWNININ